eukprot:365679-Chlamydomonas_euryale.AAC.30
MQHKAPGVPVSTEQPGAPSARLVREPLRHRPQSQALQRLGLCLRCCAPVNQAARQLPADAHRLSEHCPQPERVAAALKDAGLSVAVIVALRLPADSTAGLSAPPSMEGARLVAASACAARSAASAFRSPVCACILCTADAASTWARMRPIVLCQCIKQDNRAATTEKVGLFGCAEVVQLGYSRHSIHVPRIHDFT